MKIKNEKKMSSQIELILDLIKQFEKKTNKKAFWRGKETKAFLEFKKEIYEKKTGKKAIWRGKETKAFLEYTNAVIPEVELEKWRETFAKEFLTEKELKNKTIDQAWNEKYSVNINYEIFSWHLYNFNLKEAVKMKKKGLTPYDAFIEAVAIEEAEAVVKEKAKTVSMVKPEVHLEKQTLEKYDLMEKVKKERTESVNALTDKIKRLDEDIKKLSKERDKKRKELSDKTKNQKRDDLTRLINYIEERDEKIGNLMREKANINKEIDKLKKEIKEIDKEMGKIEKLMKKEEKIAKKEKALGLIKQYEKDTGKNMVWRGKLTKGFLNFLKLQLISESELMDEFEALKENILEGLNGFQQLNHEFNEEIKEQLVGLEKEVRDGFSDFQQLGYELNEEIGEQLDDFEEDILEKFKEKDKKPNSIDIFSSKMNYLKQLMEIPLQETKLDSLTVVDNEEVKDVKGNVYLGTQIEDEGEKGYSTVKEIEATLKQIEEDMTSYFKTSDPNKAYNYYMDGKKKVFIKIENLRDLNLDKGEKWVINRRSANARLMRLALIVRKSTKGELKNKANKIKALKIINNFRIKVGFKPLNIQDYLSNVYEIDFT